MQGIILIITLAIVVEALIEYGKSIGRAFADGERKIAVTHIAAVVLGVALCIATGADLFAAAQIRFALPSVGRVLTGILISRGSNYVSDFIKRLSTVKGGN